jgi:hypothetical protein
MRLSTWQSMEVAIDPVIAGLTAGTIHHFTIQYPNQARLFTTLYAFALTNSVFLILLLWPKNVIQFETIGQLIKDFLIFDTVYVGICYDDSNGISTLLLFYLRLYTMYISGIMESLRNSGTGPRIGCFGKILSLGNHTSS